MMANTGEVTIQGKDGELTLRYHDKAPQLSVTAMEHLGGEGTVELDRAGSFRLLEELAAAIEVAWPD